MTGAYVLAGELAKAGGRHEQGLWQLRRAFTGFHQARNKRVPNVLPLPLRQKPLWGLFLRNQVIKAFAIPGLAKFAFGRDIIDTLQLPDYEWPALVPKAT